jgi:hypothetical protein
MQHLHQETGIPQQLVNQTSHVAMLPLSLTDQPHGSAGSWHRPHVLAHQPPCSIHRAWHLPNCLCWAHVNLRSGALSVHAAFCSCALCPVEFAGCEGAPPDRRLTCSASGAGEAAPWAASSACSWPALTAVAASCSAGGASAKGGGSLMGAVAVSIAGGSLACSDSGSPSCCNCCVVGRAGKSSAACSCCCVPESKLSTAGNTSARRCGCGCSDGCCGTDAGSLKARRGAEGPADEKGHDLSSHEPDSCSNFALPFMNLPARAAGAPQGLMAPIGTTAI